MYNVKTGSTGQLTHNFHTYILIENRRNGETANPLPPSLSGISNLLRENRKIYGNLTAPVHTTIIDAGIKFKTMEQEIEGQFALQWLPLG